MRATIKPIMTLLMETDNVNIDIKFSINRSEASAILIQIEIYD